MGGCQNYGPFLGTLNSRCCIIIGIQKGTIILITTHILVDPTKSNSVKFPCSRSSYPLCQGLRKVQATPTVEPTLGDYTKIIFGSTPPALKHQQATGGFSDWGLGLRGLGFKGLGV